MTPEQQKAINAALGQGLSPQQSNAISQALGQISQDTAAGRAQLEEMNRPGVGRRVADWVGGVNRDPNIPSAHGVDLNISDRRKAAELTALLMTTASDDRLQSGIKRIFPDAEFQTDPYDNLVAIVPTGSHGQFTRFYPNARGLDWVDVGMGAGAGALGMGVGSALGALGVGGAAAIGATEAALVEGASSALSGDEFQVMDIPLGAAGGAIGAKLIPAAARGLGAAWRGFGRYGDQAVAQARSPEMSGLLSQGGARLSDIRPEVEKYVTEAARRNVDPTEALRYAEAQQLPVPVPLTRGQISGSKGQQLFEDMAASGVYGNAAEGLLAGQRVTQQQALRQNLPAMQGLLSGDGSVVQPRHGGELAQSALVAQREAAQLRANDMYATARAGDARVYPEVAAAMADDFRASLRGNYNPLATPNTNELVTSFDEIAATGDVAQMFNWRQMVSNVSNGGTPDAAAASALLRRFDDQISAAADDALLSGDDGAVAAWADAIKNYRDFSRTWKNGDGILSTLTETVNRDGAMALRVAPNDAANYLLGANASGMINKPNIVRNLQVLSTRLPKDEWDALRQEAFIRLANTAEGAARGGVPQISGANFQTQWNRLNRDNPALVSTLFNDGERQLIGQFARVSARATGGAVNSSNSASAAAGVLQQLAGALGSTTPARFLGRVYGIDTLRRAYGSVRALGAVNAAPQQYNGLLEFAGAGAGGTAVTNDNAPMPMGLLSSQQ